MPVARCETQAKGPAGCLKAYWLAVVASRRFVVFPLESGPLLWHVVGSQNCGDTEQAAERTGRRLADG